MAFSAQEIQDGGLAVLDNYLRSNPIDQIAVNRVLYKELMANVTEAAGAKQYIVEQLRYQYSSNFTWFNGSQLVTYNRRQSMQQANYAWRSAHDGVSIDEDRLVQHGIAVDDKGPGGQASGAERQILVNLLEEQMEILKLGFQEQFSRYLHLDGTSSTDAVAGLDLFVATTPTNTVGGIDRSKAGNVWWKNFAQTAIDPSTSASTSILDYMELGWRQCLRNGGQPNKIILGSTFYDAFRGYMLKSFGKMDFGQVGFKRVQTGTEVMTFHGVEMEWAPEFSDFDSNGDGGSIAWEKRCYFLNIGQNIRLRPMSGQNVITRKPPRPFDRYEYYWGMTWRGALTMNRGNGHAVLSVQ